jgi:2-dehydropantoate 2-reductase
VGLRLARQGREVVLIARGTQLDVLRRDGLIMRTPDGEDRMRLPVVAHPHEIDFRPDDAVLLCMKTQDTESAILALEASAGPDIAVFCCQNGVENERLAARHFARVFGVHIYMLASFVTPGIVSTSWTPVPGILDVGRFCGDSDAPAETFASDLTAAGFGSQVTDAIMRWKYAKLLGNLGNALDAACGANTDAPDITSALRREGVAALQAARIDYASDEELQARRSTSTWNLPEPHIGNSTWQSVARGAGSTEVDYFNGEIVLLGRLHGVPAPYNEAVRRLANRVARERLQPGAVTVDEVRDLVARLQNEGV